MIFQKRTFFGGDDNHLINREFCHYANKFR